MTVKLNAKIDHVGIAVADLAGAANAMQTLGFACTEQGQLDASPMQGYPGLNARWAFYGSGGERSPLLLLQPLSAEGPIHDFLRAREGGAQHLAFAVDDLDQVHATLSRAGVRFARSEPFVDPDGNRSHFFSIAAIPGLLFELIQWAKRPA
ncbi:MAG TPA: VOC family protein [Candidatus Binataceae bacterium]|nr:VOC family protein [Candidatus Binataceae bacterium]